MNWKMRKKNSLKDYQMVPPIIFCLDFGYLMNPLWIILNPSLHLDLSHNNLCVKQFNSHKKCNCCRRLISAIITNSYLQIIVHFILFLNSQRSHYYLSFLLLSFFDYDKEFKDILWTHGMNSRHLIKMTKVRN